MHEWRLKLYRGKYAIYWREDGRTRRCSLGATNRLEAQGRAKDYFRAVDLAQAPTFTVADLWARYRESLEGRPSHTTMGYEERAILPHFGDLLPHHITDEACEEYIAKRRAVGRKDGTILTEMNRLSNALNRAVKEGLLPRVPIIKRPSVPPPRDRYLTKDEARTFLAGVDAPHFRLFCILALTTAARLEAILGLRWDRVDMGRRRLNLQDPARQAMTKGAGDRSYQRPPLCRVGGSLGARRDPDWLDGVRRSVPRRPGRLDQNGSRAGPSAAAA